MKQKVYAMVSECVGKCVYENNFTYIPEYYTEEERKILESGGTLFFTDSDGKEHEIWLEL